MLLFFSSVPIQLPTNPEAFAIKGNKGKPYFVHEIVWVRGPVFRSYETSELPLNTEHPILQTVMAFLELFK